jgi:hypothetical protein
MFDAAGREKPFLAINIVGNVCELVRDRSR